MIRRVEIWPAPILRQKSEEVEFPAPSLPTLVKDLLDTMYFKRGAGLAAVQIGVLSRVFVMHDGRQFTNPRIAKRSPEKERMKEGCLSLPGFWEEVLRHTWVDVEFADLSGDVRTERLRGLEAQVAQHEVEHLDGKLFADRLSGGAKDRLRAALKRQVKE